MTTANGMVKLGAAVSIEGLVKSKEKRELTDIYHALQKPEMMAGIARQYRPKDEEGDKLPPEHTRVQATVEGMLKQAAEVQTRRFNATATKDWGNQKSRVDIRIGNHVLLKDVPAVYLLFLEEQLVHLATLIKTFPALDPSEEWKEDATSNVWATHPSETTRTKKVPKVITLAQPTDKHPAQVQLVQEDVIAGYWSTIKYSGALQQKRIDELLERVTKLQHAVKTAIHEANALEVEPVEVGEKIFGYLFANPKGS